MTGLVTRGNATIFPLQHTTGLWPKTFVLNLVLLLQSLILQRTWAFYSDMQVELDTGLGWETRLARHGNGLMAKILATDSTLQSRRAVRIWIAQASAVQDVTRAYTGSVANPPNNKEIYLTINHYAMELKEMCVKGMLLYDQEFSRKTLWKNLAASWKSSSKQDRGEKDRHFGKVCIAPPCCHEMRTSQVDWSSRTRMRMTVYFSDALYVYFKSRDKHLGSELLFIAEWPPVHVHWLKELEACIANWM